MQAMLCQDATAGNRKDNSPEQCERWSCSCELVAWVQRQPASTTAASINAPRYNCLRRSPIRPLLHPGCSFIHFKSTHSRFTGCWGFRSVCGCACRAADVPPLPPPRRPPLAAGVPKLCRCPSIRSPENFRTALNRCCGGQPSFAQAASAGTVRRHRPADPGTAAASDATLHCVAPVALHSCTHWYHGGERERRGERGAS